MVSYSSLFAALGVPSTLERIRSGAIPVGVVTQPPTPAGFPPALIPLWSESGPRYTGLWLHWFPRREPTYVQLSLDSGRVEEIARNYDQFAFVVVLQAIMLDEGVTPHVVELAGRLGLTADLSAIDELTLRSGDDPAALLSVPLFADNPPAVCRPELLAYHGDFILPNATPDLTRLRRVSRYELPERYPSSSVDPSWFRDPQGAFEASVKAEAWSDAWLALCSSGWTYGAAARAMRRLVVAVPEDVGFADLASTWLAACEGLPGGY